MKKKEVKRCIECNKLLREKNKSGFCNGCFRKFAPSVLSAQKKYRIKNKEKIRLYHKNYYDKNKEKIKLMMRNNWKKKNGRM